MREPTGALSEVKTNQRGLVHDKAKREVLLVKGMLARTRTDGYERFRFIAVKAEGARDEHCVNPAHREIPAATAGAYPVAGTTYVL
jgi:hypothetical protein